MENRDNVEEGEAPNVSAKNEAQNDSTATETLAVESSENKAGKTVAYAEQDTTMEEDDFGDFAAATPSEEADGEGKQSCRITAVAKPGDVEVTEPVNDVQEGGDSVNEDFGSFATSDNNADSMEETAPAAFDDPFAHLSIGVDSVATPDVAMLDSGTTPILEGEVTEEAHAGASDLEQSTSPGDDVGYFSTHVAAANTLDNESGVESDNGQDSSPDNDAGYFSAVTDGDDDDTVEETEEKAAYADEGKSGHNTGIEEQASEPNENMIEDVDENHALEETLQDESVMNVFTDKAVQSDTRNDEQDAMTEEYVLGLGDGNDADVDAITAAEDSNEVRQPEMDDVSSEHTKEVGEDSGGSNNAAGDDDDDANFGAFEQVKGTDEQDAACGTSESKVENDMHQVEEFSSFEVVEETEVKAEEIVHDDGAHTDAAGDDDDFGDFGAFEEVTATTTEMVDGEEAAVDGLESGGDAVQSEEGLRSADLVAQTDVHVDAVPVEKEENVATDEVGGDDDDFGDFGSFEQADETTKEETHPTSSGGAAKPVEEPADDDFGDFGSFEQAGEAQTEVKSAEEPTPVAQQGDEDDFGNFGDFTDFSSETANQGGTEPPAGVNAATESSVVGTPSPPSATIVADPIIEKADTVFQDVFGRSGRESEIDQNVSERVVVTVKSTLVC